MAMLTNKEQSDLNKWEDEQRNQRITDKIYKLMSEAEERILKNVAPIQQKVDEHDNAFIELGKSFSAGLGNITSTFGRLTGKKS